MIEMRQRKVSKHGVVTTLGLAEGQMVTIARVDAQTQILSLASPERIEEMVALLTQPRPRRHRALMERLRKRANAGSALLRPSFIGEIEQDAPISEAQAGLFATWVQNRRPF
jgi:hypothetical protein